MSDYIIHDHNEDGIDRRGFLKCMAWAGTGAFCVLQGGVLKSFALGQLHHHTWRLPQRRAELCTDQRQPHRIQQAGEP